MPQNAVKSLTLPSLTPDFVPKILATLFLHPVPSTAAQLVLKFLRFATPDLTSDQEVDIKVDALARVNFREAWEFVESLDVGERKHALVKRVIVATLSRASLLPSCSPKDPQLTGVVLSSSSQACPGSPPAPPRVPLLPIIRADAPRSLPAPSVRLLSGLHQGPARPRSHAAHRAGPAPRRHPTGSRHRQRTRGRRSTGDDREARPDRSRGAAADS